MAYKVININLPFGFFELLLFFSSFWSSLVIFLGRMLLRLLEREGSKRVREGEAY